MERTLKSLAKEAKARMKKGFWRQCEEELDAHLKDAREQGISESRMERYFKGKVAGHIKGEAPDEFYLIACGCVVEPFSTQSGKPHTDYLCVEEGNYTNGRWQPTRRLNGDETATLRFHTPTLLRLQLLAYS